MEQIENRRYPRVKTRNFVSFIEIDKDGQLMSHRTGTAMDTSQGGILLETHDKIESEYINLIATTLNNTLIEIKGKVVYSKEAANGIFKNGISLQGKPDENVEFVSSLIRVYNYRKKSKYHKIAY